MKLDLSFDETPKVTARSWAGPPYIVSGSGCRLTMKTLTEPEKRQEDLLERMYETVRALHDAGVDGVSDTSQEGYLRINGGEPSLYVRGSTQTDVVTLIGNAVLNGTPALQRKMAALGVSAMRQWS